MLKTRTYPPTMLALIALCISLGGAVASAPASAQGISYCVPVTMNGGFRENTCVMTGGTETWARAYPGLAGRLNVCLKVPAMMGSYANGNCGVTGGTKEWELFSSTIPVPPAQGQMAPAVIAGTIVGVKVEVKCSKGTFHSQPGEAGASTDGLVELKTCEVPKPTGCTVSEPIKAGFNGQIEESEKTVLEKLTGSKTEEGFAEVTLNGEGCALKGKTVKVKGTQKCGFDGEIETLKLEHEMICKASGSKLKLEGATATFEGTANKILSEVESTKVTWDDFG